MAVTSDFQALQGIYTWLNLCHFSVVQNLTALFNPQNIFEPSSPFGQYPSNQRGHSLSTPAARPLFSICLFVFLQRDKTRQIIVWKPLSSMFAKLGRGETLTEVWYSDITCIFVSWLVLAAIFLCVYSEGKYRGVVPMCTCIIQEHKI